MSSARQPRFPRRDRLRQLQAFCYAAKLGSMTQGAEHLVVSQPAVSLHVRELERELQARLFERTGPRISLTPAGACLYELAMPLVEGIEGLSGALAEELRRLAPGDLRVASDDAGTIHVLPRVLKRLREREPGIRVQVGSRAPGEGLEALLAGDVDLVFGPEGPVPDDVLYRPVLSCEVVLITPLDHPLAGREHVSLEEIAAFPMVRSSPRPHGGEGEDPPIRPFGVEAGTVIDVGGWDAVEYCVEAGMGVAVCESFCVREESRVSAIPLVPSQPWRSRGWFMRSGAPLSAPAERLVEAMAAEFPAQSHEVSGREQ